MGAFSATCVRCSRVPDPRLGRGKTRSAALQGVLPRHRGPVHERANRADSGHLVFVRVHIVQPSSVFHRVRLSTCRF